jgi:hypothetical protein
MSSVTANPTFCHCKSYLFSLLFYLLAEGKRIELLHGSSPRLRFSKPTHYHSGSPPNSVLAEAERLELSKALTPHPLSKRADYQLSHASIQNNDERLKSLSHPPNGQGEIRTREGRLPFLLHLWRRQWDLNPRTPSLTPLDWRAARVVMGRFRKPKPWR